METFFLVVGWFFLIYSLILVVFLLALAFMGWRRTARTEAHPVTHLRPEIPGVSVIIPAHNEAAVITSTVSQILTNRLNDFELIVVDDGSTDGTAETVIEAFGLAARPSRRPVQGIEHRPVTQVWESRDGRIVLLQKASAGTRADAVNAGIAYAAMPLVAMTDADTVLNMDALTRLAIRFEDPDVHGMGASLRALNGAQLREGRAPSPGLPSTWKERIQAVEYMRAFAGSRVGWSDLGALLIVSGGFGMYRRSTLLAVGGLDSSAVAEDFDLTLRVHRYLSERGLGERIDFSPETIAWTEVPPTRASLASQRRRWQRGLMQTLWRYRGMALRPRFGAPAMLSLPFFWAFEFAAPFVELFGLAMIPLAFLTGSVTLGPWLVMIVAVWLMMLAISILSLMIDQKSNQRYQSWPDTGRLVLAAVIENFGYRQYLLFVRAKAALKYGGDHTWEPIPRLARAEAIPTAL